MLQEKTFSDVSTTVAAMITPNTIRYFETLPERIERPIQLLHIDLGKLRIPRGREFVTTQNLYAYFKEFISNPIEEIYSAVRDMRNMIDSTSTEYVINETMEGIKQARNIFTKHKRFISSLTIDITEDVYKWFNDDLLLSIISFHAKLADKVVFTPLADEEKTKKTIESFIKNLDDFSRKLDQTMDIVTTTMMLGFEPFLVYSALYACRKNDYDFILKYENEIIRAGKIISDHDPELIRTMV